MSLPKADPQGNARGPKHSLEFVPSDPPPLPEDIGPKTKGAAVWEAIWGVAGGAYVVELDTPAIIRYCTYINRWYELEEVLSGSTLLIPGSRDQWVANPALAQQAKIEDMLGKLEQRLGLSPEARVRLGVKLRQDQRVQQAHDDSLAGFKKRHGHNS